MKQSLRTLWINIQFDQLDIATNNKRVKSEIKLYKKINTSLNAHEGKNQHRQTRVPVRRVANPRFLYVGYRKSVNKDPK